MPNPTSSKFQSWYSDTAQPLGWVMLLVVVCRKKESKSELPSRKKIDIAASQRKTQTNGLARKPVT